MFNYYAHIDPDKLLIARQAAEDLARIEQDNRRAVENELREREDMLRKLFDENIKKEKQKVENDKK